MKLNLEKFLTTAALIAGTTAAVAACNVQEVDDPVALLVFVPFTVPEVVPLCVALLVPFTDPVLVPELVELLVPFTV